MHYIYTCDIMVKNTGGIQNMKKDDIAPKGAYAYKIDNSEQEVNDNLRSNLLLIRETFKMFCNCRPFSTEYLKNAWEQTTNVTDNGITDTTKQDSEPVENLDNTNNKNNMQTSITMTTFYKALGLYDCEVPENATEKEIKDAENKALRAASDIYSKIIDGIFLKSHYESIRKNLIDAGLPERYIKKTRTALLCTQNKIDDSIYKYFAAPKKRSYDFSELKNNIYYEWSQGNQNICLLVIVVYRLVYLALPNETQDLHLANEALEKVLENDLPEYVKNSSSYAEYITTLAKSVVSIEEAFPNFYALTQQMKQEKTPQSIMNETTKALQQLQNDMKISRSDAESESCQNMMNEIAKLMLKIQQALTP